MPGSVDSKLIKKSTLAAAGIILAICCVSFISCSEDSPVSSAKETEKFDGLENQEYERDPSDEPEPTANEVVVLAHSRFESYDLAKEIQSEYNAALLHIDDLFKQVYEHATDVTAADELVEKLKIIQPEYAIVIAGEYWGYQDLQAELFIAFCSLDNSVDLDVAYGYIPAKPWEIPINEGGKLTLEQSSDIFQKSLTPAGEISDMLNMYQLFIEDDKPEFTSLFGERKFLYDWNNWVRELSADYTSSYKINGWTVDSVVVGLPPFTNNPEQEYQKFKPAQLIFAPRPNFSMPQGVSSHRVFRPDITGGMELHGSVIVSDLHWLDNGIFHEHGGYFSIDVDLVCLPFIANQLSQGGKSVGRAMQDGINDAMRYFAINELDVETNTLVQRLAITFPIGNPKFTPQLKSAVSLSIPEPL